MSEGVQTLPIEQEGLPGQLSLTGYTLPEDLPYADWEETGKKLGEQAEVQAQRMDMLRWWIGDWLLYGEFTYGEKWSQAVEVLGHRWEESTLKEWMWVADRFEKLVRTNFSLPWPHYRQAAALAPRQRTKLLQQAQDEGWSRPTVRQAIRQPQRADIRRRYPPCSTQ